jgi:hypothetical protein
MSTANFLLDFHQPGLEGAKVVGNNSTGLFPELTFKELASIPTPQIPQPLSFCCNRKLAPYQILLS